MAKQEEKVEEDYHVRIVYKEMLEVDAPGGRHACEGSPFLPRKWSNSPSSLRRERSRHTIKGRR